MDRESTTLNAQPTSTRNLAQDKWGEAMVAGHQVVPNILIQGHKQLGLDPLDVLILLNLNMHWWKVNDLPYPKPASIAARIGVTTRTVERRLQKLQKAGLVERLGAESSGKGSIKRFRLTGLVDKLSRLAKEALATRRRAGPEELESSE